MTVVRNNFSPFVIADQQLVEAGIEKKSTELFVKFIIEIKTWAGDAAIGCIQPITFLTNHGWKLRR